jgi:hypothetical protein
MFRVLGLRIKPDNYTDYYDQIPNKHGSNQLIPSNLYQNAENVCI